MDCIVYATGVEAETTPLYRRVGHEIYGRDGIRLAERWEDGPRTLFGMMSHGFPNMFIMPCPGQQAVITANHTLITVEAAEHIFAAFGRMVELARAQEFCADYANSRQWDNA